MSWLRQFFNNKITNLLIQFFLSFILFSFRIKADVGLVHQVPFTCDRKGFPSTLEKVYFGTAHARIYLSADFIGVNCSTGMSTLMRKSLIDEVGGLDSFASYLAEDFFLAKSLTDR